LSGHLPYVLAVWIFVVGVYGVVTSRNLVHLTVCVSVAQSGTYVLLLAIGYEDAATAPILSAVAESAKKVDPVVQALVLTDIVVAVAVSALLLTIALQAHARTGSLDPDDLRDIRG
jgi:multicomponent Na+:H+ antiporter subunit C